MVSLFKVKSTNITSGYNFTVTIDSPSTVSTVSNGGVTDNAGNEHGEADYAIWHHCIRESSSHILVVSSDTDTWVYGLGLYEQHLQGKQVHVQRGNTDCYIDIRKATLLMSQHPKLSAIVYPVLSLVAIYVLTGCDYVSSFYRCPKTTFLETLIQNAGFICPDGHLMKMINGEFQCVNERSWIRLVTAVYYSKFKQFFRHKPISYTNNLIISHPDSPEAKQMFSALHYTPSTGTDLSSWHGFIRRVTYHVPKVTKYHEFKLLPSYQALTLHCKRANYVLKLTLSAPWASSPFLACFEQFGWHREEDDGVTITWDEDPHDSEASDGSDSDAELSDSSSSDSSEA